jgi:purine-nucleoside phosphorylase
MSTHIAAKSGEISEKVLLPGDPLRAKWIAENFLTDVMQYTAIRNMYGFTGTYKGERISVQGTGMGQPSISIYAHELFTEYGVQTAIRIGTCGGILEKTKVGDLIIAMTASTDSNINFRDSNGLHISPAANYELLRKAADIAVSKSVHIGSVATMDLFYDQTDSLSQLIKFGTLALEMETSALYSLAAKHERKALSILTVSDHVITHEAMPAEQREKALVDMVEVALEAITL